MGSKSLRDSVAETIAQYYNFFKLGPTQQTDQQTQPEEGQESVDKMLTSKMSTVGEMHTSKLSTVDKMLTSNLSTPSVDKTPTVGKVTPLGEGLTPEEIVEMIDKICDVDTTPTTMQVLLRILIKYRNAKLMFTVRKLASELHHDHARLQKALAELHKQGIVTVFASPRGTIVDFTPLRGSEPRFFVATNSETVLLKSS